MTTRSPATPPTFRPEDEIIQSLLQDYPHPVRPVYAPWRPMQTPAYRDQVFFIVAGFAIFGWVVYDIIRQYLPETSATRSWITLANVGIGMILCGYLIPILLIAPILKWRTGQQIGLATTIRITEVTPHGSMICKGVAEVTIGDQCLKQPFRETQTRTPSWLGSLKVGDIVWALIHPETGAILILYGPADDDFAHVR